MLSESNSDFVPPVQSNEFLPPISPWTTLGGLFLVGTFGVAIALSAFTQYNVTVKAPATVRPIGEVRIVQAAVEGTVKRIEVQENQVVKKGDAIAIVDDNRLQTQKSQLQRSIQLLQLQLVQVKAQLDALESQIAAEKGLMNRSIASAVAELSRYQREYRDKQITSQTDVKEAEAAVDLAKEEKTRYQQLANTGAISLLQVKEKEQGFKAALARLERAKASLNPTVASVEIAKERIVQEEARGESTLATLNKEQKNLRQRLLEIQNQLNRDQKELQQVENDLKKSVIRAPAFGTILKLELRNSGQVVRPGEAIAEIAPNNAALVVKARVAADDISKVGVCQAQKVSDCKQGKVQMRVSAYPYPDYGTLKGKVSAIAPDVTIPKNDGTSTAAPYYEVTIQPERPLLVKSALQYPIQPGMDVRADIIYREETVLTFILRKARLITDL